MSAAHMETVRYRCGSWQAAANLYKPAKFDSGKKYPAIVCAHPISSCKEQTAALYAAGLAQRGYIALAFDASCQGESGGEPRFAENPAQRIEDFSFAADYLTTLPFIDAERIGVLGICGGGGYAVKAAMTERRFKAVATVAGANYGRLLREGDFSPDAAVTALAALSAQRTAEARGAARAETVYIPNSQAEREQAGIADIDIREAVDYYKTPRGAQPGSPNRLLATSIIPAFSFDAYHLAEHLLTQPLQIIIGSVPGGFGSYRDGFQLYAQAASKQKNLFIAEGMSHYDLYDKPQAVAQALAQLERFYGRFL